MLVGYLITLSIRKWMGRPRPLRASLFADHVDLRGVYLAALGEAP